MPNVLVLRAVDADGLRRLAAEPGFKLLPGADTAPDELPTLLACAEAGPAPHGTGISGQRDPFLRRHIIEEVYR